jgi:hypothetical protein
MGDFARWVVACEPALPWKAGTFLSVYNAQRQEEALKILENDAVAAALVEWADSHLGRGPGVSECSMDEWHKRLTKIVNDPEHAKIDYGNWPKDATRLSKHISRITPFLSEKQLVFEKLKRKKTAQPYRLYRTPLQEDLPLSTDLMEQMMRDSPGIIN